MALKNSVVEADNMIPNRFVNKPFQNCSMKKVNDWKHLFKPHNRSVYYVSQ